MTRGISPILVVLAFSVAHGAWAQSEGPGNEHNVSVLSRPRPDYEALGTRVGGFLVFPKVTIGATYDDNIFADETNQVSDTIFNITPSVQAVSQWSRHQLSVTAAAHRAQYVDHSSESSTDYNIGTDGRLDVDRFTTLTGSARYGREIEARSAIEANQNEANPVRYDQVDWAVGGSHQFNRLRFNLDAAQTIYTYDNNRTLAGTPLSEKYRDVTDTKATVRVDYNVSQDTFLFVQGRYNKQDYDQEPPAVPTSRDSDGYEFTAGADFDLSNLLRGRLEAGYLRQEFKSPLYRPFTGLQVRGRVEYYPTQLTTITVLGSRAAENSGLVQSPSYLSTAAGLQIDHELFRNVILTARGDYEHAHYSGVDRNDNRYGISAGGTYLLNRNVGVSLTYYYLDQQSTGIDRGGRFRDNRVLLTTTLQY